MNATYYTALFIIAALVLFIAFVSWFTRYQRKERKRKLFAGFDDFVIKNNLTIDKKEIVNNNMIGLDRLNMKLVFIDNSQGLQKNYLINLKSLSNCRLIKKRNSDSGYISNISLQCIFKQKDKPDIILPFYDELRDNVYKMMQLSRKASYWEKTITIFKTVAAQEVEN